MALTWQQKYEMGSGPHVDVLDKDFSDLKRGMRMLISCPAEIEAYMRAIPRGQFRSVFQARADLARGHKADGTCPLTTGIFLRIVAEVALDQLKEGKSRDEIAPFWRMIEPRSPLAEKLSCGPEFVAEMSEAEREAA